MITIDFEYRIMNNDWDTAELVSVACGDDVGIHFFRLETDKQQQRFRDWYGDKRDIMCFAANAEVCALSKLDLEVGDVIDLWNESKMITLTHEDFYTQDNSLAGIIKLMIEYRKSNRQTYGYLYQYTKKDVRDVIIENKTYTEQQWQDIEKYNIRDVEALNEIWTNFVSIAAREIGYTREDMIRRGEFARACALALFRTQGFPVDLEFLEDVYSNKDEILAKLYREVNEVAGREVYVFTAERETRGNKRFPSRVIPASWKFSQINFEKVLEDLNLLDSWQKTDTGKARKNEDTFEKFLSNNKNHPFVSKLYVTNNTAKAFKSTDYRLLANKQGYVKCPSFPFHQKTGRSSPKPKLGFVMNLQPWMRRMIVPKEGMCLIHADWGKQEIAIAAALSGDEAFKKDYYTDIYTENARLCGLLGPDEFDKDIRQKFKSIVLGMGYGKQEESVARDLQMIFGMSKVEAEQRAAQLFEMRRQKYSKYYKWVEDTINESRIAGEYRTIDNWIYFVNDKTSRTQLQNLPMQSNGAAIMRRGFIRAVDAGLDVVCSLHDALYINSSFEHAETNSNRLTECMRLAVSDILGDDIFIENDVAVYKPNQRYYDAQGRDVVTLKLLGEKFAKYL